MDIVGSNGPPSSVSAEEPIYQQPARDRLRHPLLNKEPLTEAQCLQVCLNGFGGFILR